MKIVCCSVCNIMVNPKHTVVLEVSEFVGIVGKSNVVLDLKYATRKGGIYGMYKQILFI
ncbi:hypothetical protein [uncultured Metabacillus sp.]|uniref:hypothetical protein n=1 Tax=uncultured Metabacillus sp. TaxID=2860135 RepID=UPI002616F5D2|nr:hypothetical protein [uncultured Metabacillus sp.]